MPASKGHGPNPAQPSVGENRPGEQGPELPEVPEFMHQIGPNPNTVKRRQLLFK